MLLAITSCQDDDFTEAHPDRVAESGETGNGLSYRPVSLDGLRFSPQIIKAIGPVTAASPTGRSALPDNVMYNESLDLYIDARGLAIAKDGYQTLTFRIIGADSLSAPLKNLVLNEERDGSYTAYIYTYDLTDQELKDIYSGDMAVWTDRISVSRTTNAYGSGPVPCREVTVVQPNPCFSGDHNYGDTDCVYLPGGDDDQDDPSKVATPPTIWTYWDCTGGSGSDAGPGAPPPNTGPTPPDPGPVRGGGGSNGSGDNTNVPGEGSGGPPSTPNPGTGDGPDAGANDSPVDGGPPTKTVPIDPDITQPPPDEPDTPCEALAAMDDETPTIKSLKSRAGQSNREYGYTFSTDQAPQEATPKESWDPYSLNAGTGGTIYGCAHTHPNPAQSGSFPFFSFNDMMWLVLSYTRWGNGDSDPPPRPNPAKFFNTLTVWDPLQAEYRTYALKIEDWMVLSQSLNGLTSEDFGDLSRQLTKRQTLITKNGGNYVKDFYSFLQEKGLTGIGIYEATDDNLSNWNKLEYNPETNQMEPPQPC